MKKGNFFLILLVCLFTLAEPIFSASSDSIDLTVTPTGDRGVIIDSSTYDFGSLDMGVSTISVQAIPVTTTGTISNIEYTLQGANNSTWTLESDGTTTPSAENKAVLQALFQNTAAQPADSDFGSDDTVTTGAQQVGDGSPGEFEGTGDMDNMGLLNKKYLFFRLTTPPTSSVTAQQQWTVTIAAEVAN